MAEWRQWLLTSVAPEYANKGLANVDIYYVAQEYGISKESLNVRFSDEKELIKSLISEIANTHKDCILQAIENISGTRDRLVHFIVASMEFVEQNPVLGNVIINSLYSTDHEIKDHVYEVYTSLFELMIPHLQEEGIITRVTYALISDLSTVLLSVVFMGNCPQMVLEYTSWVDLYRVADSVIIALRKRYQNSDIEARFL